MRAAAFASPPSRAWRWRILSSEGEMVGESQQAFPTSAAAVASGPRYLIEANVANRPELARLSRWSGQRRH